MLGWGLAVGVLMERVGGVYSGRVSRIWGVVSLRDIGPAPTMHISGFMTRIPVSKRDVQMRTDAIL